MPRRPRVPPLSSLSEEDRQWIAAWEERIRDQGGYITADGPPAEYFERNPPREDEPQWVANNGDIKLTKAQRDLIIADLKRRHAKKKAREERAAQRRQKRRKKR